MLNRHPRICVPFESAFIVEFYRSLGLYGDLTCGENVRRLVEDIGEHPFVRKGGLLSHPEEVLDLRPSSYRDVVDGIFRVHALKRGKPRWGDKTPGYVTELDVLWKLFPESRVLHVVRDGRDVALSYGRISWGSRHLPTVARDWSWKVTLGHKMGAMMGEHYLEVRYEDLVLAPQSTLMMVCGFLGESFEREMLDFAGDASAELPEDSLQWHRSSVSPPDPTKVNEWRRRMRFSDAMLFDEIAGEALELFGYERVRERTLRSRLKSVYYSTIQRW
jgi:hypothetical protein